MPSRRPCLSDDLKQAINELDYLSMSVAEAMCDFYRMNTLQEVEAEQRKLLDIGAAVSLLLNWRCKAVDADVRRLFEMADHACIGNNSVPGNTSSHTIVDYGGLGTTANIAAALPGEGCHWKLLDVVNAHTAVMQNMVHVNTTFTSGLISVDCLDNVLLALWNSQKLAAASTHLAAQAVLALEDIEITDAVQRPNIKNRTTHCDSDRPARTADDPEDPPKAEAMKAAKKTIRDMFLWRAGSEMFGLESRIAVDQIMKREGLSQLSISQLVNGASHLEVRPKVKPPEEPGFQCTVTRPPPGLRISFAIWSK